MEKSPEVSLFIVTLGWGCLLAFGRLVLAPVARDVLRESVSGRFDLRLTAFAAWGAVLTGWTVSTIAVVHGL